MTRIEEESGTPNHPALFGVACLAPAEEIEAIEMSRNRLEMVRGTIASISEAHPFDLTDYYEGEMGTNLTRSFWIFAKESPVETLPELKHRTREIETALSSPGGDRRVNLDPFYIDHHKLVLASFKPAGHRIYLNRGVWADLALRYHRGRWQAFDWTFPDFRDDRYHPFLTRMRAEHLASVRSATA